MIIAIFRLALEEDISFIDAIPFIAIAAIPMEASLFLKRVSLPSKILGWRRLLYHDVPRISDINISIHYSLGTTMVLIGICSPLVTLLFMPDLTPIPSEVSVWAALQLGSLVLRWFCELLAQREIALSGSPFLAATRDGYVGTGNEELDICWHRFYAKSRLTLCVETAIVWALEKIPRMWTAIRTWRNWSAYVGSARRDRPRWARSRRGVANDYADDGDNHLDADGHLLLPEFHDSVDG